MTDDIPLWLRIALGVVPLLAALIAGAFALANTLNRRIERLKNLTDTYDKFPSWLNHGNGIEKLMLAELHGIERATTPWYRWYRRAVVAGVSIYLATYAATMVPGIYGTNTGTRLTYVALGAILIAGILVKWSGGRQRKLDLPHRIRLEILKAVAEEKKAYQAKKQEKRANAESPESQTPKSENR
jgi:hypothetical protein